MQKSKSSPHGADNPQPSINEGVCDYNECTMIGIGERNSDGSVDCAIETLVNIDSKQVGLITYFGSFDDERATP